MSDVLPPLPPPLGQLRLGLEHDLKVPSWGGPCAGLLVEKSGSWLPESAAVNMDFHDGRSSKDGSIVYFLCLDEDDQSMRLAHVNR